MTTSGHSADTHGLTADEPNLPGWERRQEIKIFTERKLLMDRFRQSFPGDVHVTPKRKQPLTMIGKCFTYAYIFIYIYILAQRHVHCQEQGRNALNSQQAGCERAAQDFEEAARDEVHVAVAQATEVSGKEMREMMGALDNPAEQNWISHQVSLRDKTNSVAGDSGKTRRSLLNEATADLPSHQRQHHERISAGCSTPRVTSSTKSSSPTGCE